MFACDVAFCVWTWRSACGVLFVGFLFAWVLGCLLFWVCFILV